jgi:superfamily I DNA and/or RNA helicase
LHGSIPNVINQIHLIIRSEFFDQVVFIDHTAEEGADDDESWLDKGSSKVNLHEIKMVSAIVRYIYQQGYSPQNMVVLTPYLGQLVALQRALANDWSVMIDGKIIFL